MKTHSLFDIAFTVVSLLLVIAPRAADTSAWKLPRETARLKPGPGVELVTAQCLLCHSAEYISSQPPLSRAAWTASVTKMKDKYGAPVAAENMEKLVDYLTKTYGNERPQTKPQG
jgi:hypothetical protein